MGRILSNIAGMARILDAATVLVGMQPAVDITLIELGLPLTGVYTVLNLEKGIAFLHTKTGGGRMGIPRTTMPNQPGDD